MYLVNVVIHHESIFWKKKIKVYEKLGKTSIKQISLKFEKKKKKFEAEINLPHRVKLKD